MGFGWDYELYKILNEGFAPGGTNTLVTRVESSNLYRTDSPQTIADGGELSTGYIDMQEVDKYQIYFKSDITGLELHADSKTTLDGAVFTTPGTPFTDGSLFQGSFPPRERYIQFRLVNNTGSSATNTFLSVKGSYGSADKASVFPIGLNPVANSGAILTQSVSIGQNPAGEFVNVGVNQAGAALVADFGTEVARGLYDGYAINPQFGRNPDIDTDTTPEDIHNGGSTYTGFNATGNEEISVTSADNNDRGQLLSSGTATGGTATTLTDSGATFVTDGVTVGDLVINDTQGLHGVITSLTETQLTVFQMVDGPASSVYSNAIGDSYRVATAIDTGAAVLRLNNVLDEDYVQQRPVYVILNGTTTVTTSGVNAMRCDTGRVVISGSSAKNEGEITITQAVSTSNVFCVIPTFGSTTIGCFTVPAGKDCIIKKIVVSIVRANGSLGSATIALNVRKFGQAFCAERVYEANTGAPVVDDIEGGIVLPPGTDVKGTVEVVSDNNTVAQITIEYFYIDRSD